MEKRNIIMIDEGDLEELVHQVTKRLLVEFKSDVHDRWISAEEAMKKLGITSNTTLQKYRDEGKIRFSQPSKKVIQYDRFSIDEFLDKNAKDTF
ncbi:MAG: helix-turn-helix domain-containing protein [Desulfobacterales bacterium]|nr:helix-turn-helix domain-containing protein [Desulfobacterales bacterium]